MRKGWDGSTRRGRDDAEEREPDRGTLDAIAQEGRWPPPPEWRTTGGGRRRQSGGRRGALEQGSARAEGSTDSSRRSSLTMGGLVRA